MYESQMPFGQLSFCFMSVKPCLSTELCLGQIIAIQMSASLMCVSQNEHQPNAFWSKLFLAHVCSAIFVLLNIYQSVVKMLVA